MSTHYFSTGKLIRWRDTTFEIKRLLPDHQVNLENIMTGAALIVNLSDLVTDLYDGHLLFVLEGKHVKPTGIAAIHTDLADYPEKARAAAKFHLRVIEPLLDRPRTRQDVIDYVEEFNKTNEQKISAASVYRWLADYEGSGRDIRALATHAEKQGGKGTWRVEPEVNILIDAVIKDKYFAREKKTIDDLRHEIAVRIQQENLVRPAQEKLKLPARTTIERRVKALDLKEVFAAKHGKRAAERQFTQFGQGPRPELPLERVEIDHTRLDLIVIDDQDNLPLGRATLTDCMDVATSYPLGYYLGFEPPSYYAVMECLYHAIRPKGNTREKYGTAHDWIAYGIPFTLVTDNGKEFINLSLADACLQLNMVLEHTPIRTPHYKGKIERFMLSSAALVHTLPGTTFSNIMKRGDYDSENQACIYLSEAEAILNIFFVDIYAEQFHQGLDGIPARRWERVIENGFQPRGPGSAEELLILLGRLEKRSVNPYGIDINRIRYNSPELAYLRNNLKKGEEVKVKYHPGDLSRIHVYNHFSGDYITVPANDDEGYTVGLSLWKHKVIRRYLLEQQDEVDLVALGKAKRAIQEIVDAARSRKRTRSRSRLARWDGSGQPPSLADQKPTTPPALPEPPVSSPALPAPRTEIILPPESSDEGWGITYDRPRSSNGGSGQ
ncbi:MAG: DDE-type integrase/transposase/recombinase [Anaerolineae bacterium]|nr:DDE-type integrase/transposase/recombinase [Anaerolineae bacterium]